MKFLIFAVLSFLLDATEVWSLECWTADYADCKLMHTIDEIFNCAKHQERKFTRGECYKKCGRAIATFTDKSKVELRFCQSEHVDDCKEISRLIEGHESGSKELSKELECSICNSPLCNDPNTKSKNGSGIQDDKFSNIFILVTIVLTILTAF